MEDKVDKLIERLSGWGYAESIKAAKELGKLKDRITDEQFNKIVAGLKDYSYLEPHHEELKKKRRVCALALGEIGRREAVEPLIGRLADSKHVREAAVEALAKIGDPKGLLFADVFYHKKKERIPELKDHVDLLIKFLNVPYKGIKSMAADALEKAGDPKGVLFSEVFYHRKEERISELRKYSDDVMLFLSSRYWFVELPFEKLVKQITDKQFRQLIEGLENEDWGTREGCARALGSIGRREAVEPLIKALDYGSRFHANSPQTAESLGKLREHITEDHIRMIVSGLDDKNCMKRVGCVFAIGELEIKEAVRKLIFALSDGSASLAVSKVLPELGDPLGIAFLNVFWSNRKEEIPKLRNHIDIVFKFLELGEEENRERAAIVVGQLKNHIDSQRFQHLVDSLKAEHWWKKQGCALALGELGRPEAVDPLIAALGDDVWLVRRAAARALGKLKAAKAVDSLIAALGDDASLVRSAVAEVLEKLSPHAKPEQVQKKGVVEFLINATADKDQKVRKAALDVFLKVTKTEDRQFLKEVNESLLQRLSKAEGVHKHYLIFMLNEITKRENKLLEPEAKKIKLPKLKKRKPKRKKVWRAFC